MDLGKTGYKTGGRKRTYLDGEGKSEDESCVTHLRQSVQIGNISLETFQKYVFKAKTELVYCLVLNI